MSKEFLSILSLVVTSAVVLIIINAIVNIVKKEIANFLYVLHTIQNTNHGLRKQVIEINDKLERLNRTIKQNENIIKVLETIAKQSRIANRLKATEEYYKGNLHEKDYNEIMDSHR